MPILNDDFKPLRWMLNGHVQTILGGLQQQIEFKWSEKHRLILSDGDEIYWYRNRAQSANANSRVVIFNHGLEGSAHAYYIKSMAKALWEEGFDVVGWSYRGCDGIPNLRLRSYHSGAIEDLSEIVLALAKEYSEVHIVGFSLGANMVLKYACHSIKHESIKSVAAISAPIDLTSSAYQLDKFKSNFIYRGRFLRTLKAKALYKAHIYSDELNDELVRSCKNLYDFDEYYTAPVHGFQSAADYWSKCSAKPDLNLLSIPALLMSSRDDPMLGVESFPCEIAENNDFLYFILTNHGGHVAFIDEQKKRWYEGKYIEWLKQNVIN
jgi:uncharacterized protein